MRQTGRIILVFTLALLGACDTKTKTVNSCGDGYLDPGEECDGTSTSVETCAELGYYDQLGILTCRSDCTLDLAVCSGGRCGDGLFQEGEGEQCDGAEPAETTCENLGLGGGTLSCKASCRWDVSRCELTALCGDQVAASPYEPCDGTDLDDQTCVSLGFRAGVLACREDCSGFDTSACTTCGDGEVDEEEQCDGTNLGGGSCATEGFYEGTLACDPDCRYRTTGCSGRCGDGEVQGDSGETCDGSVLGGATCESRGYSARGGTLGCTTACLGVVRR